MPNKIGGIVRETLIGMANWMSIFEVSWRDTVMADGADALGCQRKDNGASRGSEGHAPCRSAILEDSKGSRGLLQDDRCSRTLRWILFVPG